MSLPELKCYFCERVGVKSFLSAYLGNCTFDGKKRKEFTLVQCANKKACDARKAKLAPKEKSNYYLEVKLGDKVKFIMDESFLQATQQFAAAMDNLKKPMVSTNDSLKKLADEYNTTFAMKNEYQFNGSNYYANYYTSSLAYVPNWNTIQTTSVPGTIA